MAKVSFEILRDLILEVNPAAAHQDLAADTPLFNNDILDSYLAVLLVQKIEDRFEIAFNYSDLRNFFFETIGSIQSLLIKKYGCGE